MEQKLVFAVAAICRQGHISQGNGITSNCDLYFNNQMCETIGTTVSNGI
jgi:hypothetical protein